MPTAARARAGAWSLLEAGLLVGALLTLALAAASVPDAVLGIGDSATTGASLLLVGAGAAALTAKPHKP